MIQPNADGLAVQPQVMQSTPMVHVSLSQNISCDISGINVLFVSKNGSFTPNAVSVKSVTCQSGQAAQRQIAVLGTIDADTHAISGNGVEFTILTKDCGRMTISIANQKLQNAQIDEDNLRKLSLCL